MSSALHHRTSVPAYESFRRRAHSATTRHETLDRHHAYMAIMRITTSVLLLLCFVLSTPAFAATAAEQAAAGNAALERNDPEKAADLFEKAIALEPNNAKYHFLLGTAYSQMAERASAFGMASLAKKSKAAFERSVELDPNNVEARLVLVQYYVFMPGFLGGGDDKALAQAAEIKKRDALAGHRAYARVYTHQKKKDLALKELVEAVREQPNSAPAHYYLGHFYQTEQNWPAAQHEYDFALNLDANYMPLYFRIGQLAVKSGKDLPRGEESLRKYLGFKPGFSDPSLAAAWYWLGQLQEKTGKKAEAKASYTNGLKLSPGDKDIASALKRMS